MANKNILTYNATITEIENTYFSPVAVLPTSGQTISTMYCFMSRAVPWADEQNPDQPTQDQAYLKTVHKNIFALKKIQSSDISAVAERIDWTANTTYDYYKDNVNMFQTDSNGFLLLHFYVRNSYDQVFKCLWNNNGATSTNEPMFQPGFYGTDNIYQAADKYKWKYIYTIDTGTKTKFMDSKWIPVPIKDTSIDPIATAAGSGDIESINVINGGSGFDPANSIINIAISGDGIGATATATSSNGTITSIVIANQGTNYSYANVSVITSIGGGAVIEAPVSPVGGHGYDPVSELGCSHVMLTTSFNGSEGGFIPTDMDYRQIGIINNPLAKSTYPDSANSTIYKTTTDLIVASGFGLYTNDETVYQGTSLATASFKATVLSFDSVSNIIKLINTTGTPLLNAPVFGQTSGTVRTVLSVNTPDYITFSGKINYIENRTGIQRSPDGIEQFKFILGY
jgi:hypothetical protein